MFHKGSVCEASVIALSEKVKSGAAEKLWVWGIGRDQGLAEDLPGAVIKGLLSEAKQAEKCSFLNCPLGSSS